MFIRISNLQRSGCWKIAMTVSSENCCFVRLKFSLKFFINIQFYPENVLFIFPWNFISFFSLYISSLPYAFSRSAIGWDNHEIWFDGNACQFNQWTVAIRELGLSSRWVFDWAKNKSKTVQGSKIKQLMVVHFQLMPRPEPN